MQPQNHYKVCAVKIIALIFSILILGCIGRTAYVSDVIDGDTIELDNGARVRLAGINAPEKGELCYDEAKEYLEKAILLKNVRVVEYGRGKYGRVLAEVYLNGENINKKMLEKGLANAYHGDVDEWEAYVKAEHQGVESMGCMWKRSNASECVVVEKIGMEFEVRNECNVTIDTFAIIRDTSSSHRFNAKLRIPPYEKITIHEGCESDSKNIGLCKHVFNYDGDELMIYDNGGLVAKTNYGIYSMPDTK